MIEFLSQWMLPIAVGLIIAGILQRFVLFTVLVSSGSMEPGIASGDRLLMRRRLARHQVNREDIIAFYSHEYGLLMVKRVIGLPGESVTIQSEGQVRINGDQPDESDIYSGDEQSATFHIPQHHFLLLGDNRKHSTDSRSWNQPFIDEKDIIGKAIFRVFPFRRMRFFGNYKQE